MKRVLKQGNKIKIIVSIMILVSIAGLIVIYPAIRKRDGTRMVAGYERDYIYYDRKLTVDDFRQFGYETTYQEVIDAVGEENGELAYNYFYPYYELSDGTYAVVEFFMGNKVHGIYIADKKEILYHLLPHVVPYKKDEEKEKELSYARQYEMNIVLELFEIKEWQKPQASGEADDPMWGYRQEELEMYTNENWHIEIEYWFDDYEDSNSESLYQSIKVYQNDELCGSALIIWNNCLVLECELLPVKQSLSIAWGEEEKMQHSLKKFTNSQFTCEKTIDGYEVTLYDRKNNAVFDMVYPKEPWIREIDDDILEIGISTGSPSSYVFYFEKETSKISDTYFNSILLDNKYIAYMDDGELVISDLFDKRVFYKNITRDFTKTANPSSAIISIELVDEENLIIEYYKGEDYEEVEEVISFAENNSTDSVVFDNVRRGCCSISVFSLAI